jgi:hypothetical protein
MPNTASEASVLLVNANAMSIVDYYERSESVYSYRRTAVYSIYINCIVLSIQKCKCGDRREPVMSVHKYPDCPMGWVNCSFKMGEITSCDGQCNTVSPELCSNCKEEQAETTIYGQRVCYDCAAKVYDEHAKHTH